MTKQIVAYSFSLKLKAIFLLLFHRLSLYFLKQGLIRFSCSAKHVVII